MGINFSAFEIGRRALKASHLGLTVAGQNIANVNTPGYTRQAAQFSASPTDGSNLALVGTGVTIDGVRSFRDRFVESRLNTETAISGRLSAQRDALAPVNAVFNDADGTGLSAALNNFFHSFADLESHPTSVPLRGDVAAKGAALATAFRSTRGRLVDIRRDTDSALRATLDDANTVAQQVAALNARISIVENTGARASELRDQRGEAVRQLAELTGGRAIETPDGNVTVTLADGRALVAGERAAALQAVDTPPDGLASLVIDGQPATITDGRLGGLLGAVGAIGTHITALDDLAASVVSRVNTLHASGSDLNGADGTDFFATPAAGAPVTAANIAVSAAIQANPRLVVAAARGAGSGDATVARGLAALLNDPTSTAGARTGSFAQIYASVVADAGQGVKSAEDALVTQQAILAQAQAQRDAFSGVSLDEEAINLLQYQKAYEAAARFLKVADELTQTIISLGA
jgi:flagellar hook-associated protein 1 FlgK